MRTYKSIINGFLLNSNTTVVNIPTVEIWKNSEIHMQHIYGSRIFSNFISDKNAFFSVLVFILSYFNLSILNYFLNISTFCSKTKLQEQRSIYFIRSHKHFNIVSCIIFNFWVFISFTKHSNILKFQNLIKLLKLLASSTRVQLLVD